MDLEFRILKRDLNIFVFEDDPMELAILFEEVCKNRNKKYIRSLFNTMPFEFCIELKPPISPSDENFYIYFNKDDEIIKVFRNLKSSWGLELVVDSDLFGINGSFESIKVYLAYVAYINFINNKPRIRKSINNKKFEFKTKNNIQSRENLNRNVQILDGNRIIYESNIENLNYDLQKRNYTRKTEAWMVLGFTRRLKSGKIVQVKPHIRGHGKVNKKEYLVK
ncbi:hypothetical protein ACSXBY_04345 [Clostridium perfringens]|uniref:hypothetical protein n=1 Tax=Clostridium perfringens TaxID=1502 RepID=UPI0001669286|nr:hypothetical protein [Clostridium perfringens]AXH51922.1 hypothetical protein C8114_04650 [Clostridium perfringens]EDS81379.1 hypothetical protein CPC_0904 [Clostridium perfringens C str. JGS1495]MBI6029890.1 hypothetical protein [Clostridium perfringens]MBI6032612.1 hypothetical protein [Clostridium perfringens]MBI6069242.1 hypothetical protein [Clostridium perfringens]